MTWPGLQVQRPELIQAEHDLRVARPVRRAGDADTASAPPAAGAVSPSAIAYSWSIRAFLAAYSGSADDFQVFTA